MGKRKKTELKLEEWQSFYCDIFWALAMIVVMSKTKQEAKENIKEFLHGESTD